MDYIRFAITNPVKVSVGVILLLGFGFLAVATIPIQLTPNVDQPVITVTTNWTGRSPQEVESEVVEAQEDKLKGVSNLKKMVATAQTGRAEITLEFYIGTNMNRALQEVSDSLREVADYPDEVDEPVIASAETSAESPIAWTILTADDPDYNVEQLKDVAEERIKPYLERVEGLAEVRVYGGRSREVHIQVNPTHLAGRGITFNELRRALQLHNLDSSAGDLPSGRLDFRIRTVGQYDDLEQIEQTIVKNTDGGPIKVKDIAKVELSLERRRAFVRSKGENALAIPAYRETGSNVVKVMQDFQAKLDEVNNELLPAIAPPGVTLKITQVYDETVYIYDAIDLVRNNLWLGGSLAVMVLLLFLGGSRHALVTTIAIGVMLVSVIALIALPNGSSAWWIMLVVLAGAMLTALVISRPVAIIGLAIPVSVVGTFVAMTAAGRNLNVISLAGLAFAVGMVVDNAIVVLENIDRHRNMGKPVPQAAYEGSKEVWGAVLASTLTTVAVFGPVLTIQEEAGQLFRDIALAVCAAVLLSLIVSVTVIPTAAGRWLRRREKQTDINKIPAGVLGVNRMVMWGSAKWSSVIHALSAPNAGGVLARVAIIAVLTLGSIIAARLLMPPATYLPSGNRNLVFGLIFTPPGYSLDHNETIARRVEAPLRPYWEAKTYEDTAQLPPVMNQRTQTTYDAVPPIENFFFVSFGPSLFFGAASADKELVEPIGPLMANSVNGRIPGAFAFAQQTSLFGRGLGGSNSIDVDIVGTDLEDVTAAANAMFGRFIGDYGYEGVRPDPGNFNLAGPELQVHIDPVRAADLGVDVSSAGLAMQALVDGAIVGDYRLKGESIDIKLTRDPAYDLKPENMGQVPMAYVAPDGSIQSVPLDSIVDFIPADAPQQIKRIEELRAVTLTVTPPPNVPLEAAMGELRATAEEMRQQGAIAPGVQIDLAGTASKLTEVQRAMMGEWTDSIVDTAVNVFMSRLFWALLITYLLMAALFESFLYPFVILFSVPLAAVGGFIGLWITRQAVPTQQLDVLTMLGFVILIGVVVNNAILIVHQALNFMRGIGETVNESHEKLAPRDAVRESVRTRVRPIMMTTATSVLGMLPLVIMGGAGSELYKGLGSVVIGGLIVSGIFTLLVVPLLFTLVLDTKMWVYGMLNWEMPETASVTAADEVQLAIDAAASQAANADPGSNGSDGDDSAEKKSGPSDAEFDLLRRLSR